MKIEALTRAAFKPFGDVIERDGVEAITINQGFAQKFRDQAKVDVAMENGFVNISLFTAQPRPAPVAISLMERHPLGSQLFMPLQNRPWLVLVCFDPQDQHSYRLFRATGEQGINYARNVWHHPLLVHDVDSQFIVVDRGGTGVNLEEVFLSEAFHLT